MLRHLSDLLHDESGVTSVEYALLLSVVVLAAVASWRTLGQQLVSVVDRTSELFAEAPR